MNTAKKVNNQYIEYDKEAVKSIPIVDVLESMGLEVNPRGNTFQMTCPFPEHRDGTPSFTVYTQTNSFNCFGCGNSGDNIRLVEVYLNLDYRQSLKWLSETFRIPPLKGQNRHTRQRTTGAMAKIPPQIERLRTANIKPENSHYRNPRDYSDLYLAFWNRLEYGELEAMEYLSKRGISPWAVEDVGIRALPVGYDRQKEFVQSLTDDFGFDRVKDGGLINHKGTLTFWQHRLILPYWNLEGDQSEIWNFQGRDIDGKANHKYRLLAGMETIPYMIEKIPTEGRVYFCEGAIDVLSAYELGEISDVQIRPVIGLAGANAVKESLFGKVEGLEVVTIPDTDKGGQTFLNQFSRALKDRGKATVKELNLSKVKAHLGIDTGKDFNDILRTYRDMNHIAPESIL